MRSSARSVVAVCLCGVVLPPVVGVRVRRARKRVPWAWETLPGQAAVRRVRRRRRTVRVRPRPMISIPTTTLVIALMKKLLLLSKELMEKIPLKRVGTSDDIAAATRFLASDGASYITGAVLQMTAHGLMTALFFLLIGGMYDQSHNRELPNFSGMAKQMPIWTIFFVFAAMASLGLPGLSGFVAELHIFIGAFRAYPIVGGLAVLTAAITTTYLMRGLAQAFFGEMNPRWNHLKEITMMERAGATVLAGAILMLGIWPSPWIDRIGPSIVEIAHL